MKNIKKITLAVLLITSFNSLFQASSNSSDNAEYRNTRRLFAALGLKHTKDLVMNESEKELMNASRADTQEIMNSCFVDLLKRNPVLSSKVSTITEVIKDQAARKDLKIQFINSTMGYGVFATKAMPEYTVIGVYSGKINSTRQTNQDYAFPFQGIVLDDDSSENSSDSDLDFFIDASQYGNVTRFINHSNDHNCYTLELLDHHGVPQVVFVTRDPIRIGEQLTINYGEAYNWAKKPVVADIIISK